MNSLKSWKNVARYGVDQIILTNHESGWSDYWDESSSTIRRRTARLKGGDAYQAALSKQLKALGFRYGPYNNYCGFLPVNEYWDENFTIRTSSGQWLQQYPHPCKHYAVKPSRAVELEAEITPTLKETLGFDCAYLAVHTAWGTFAYVDYDARVPGAGTFAATYYAYGELMLNQQKVWQGPVFGEGGVHWIYAGLICGTYASEFNHSTRRRRRRGSPSWIVSSRLRLPSATSAGWTRTRGSGGCCAAISCFNSFSLNTPGRMRLKSDTPTRVGHCSIPHPRSPPARMSAVRFSSGIQTG